MPTLPAEPNCADKVAHKKHQVTEKHHSAYAKITKMGKNLMEQRFPDCLRVKKTRGRLPTSLTLKDAFESVLDNTLSEREKHKEYLKYGEKLHALVYSHKPGTRGLAVYLGQLERLRRLQSIVEPAPGEE